MRLPADHPHRVELNDEVHARPPEALRAPLRISYLAILNGPVGRAQQRARVAALAERFAVEPPAENAVHYSVDMGPFRVKWELHTEFTRYTFFVAGAGPDAFDDPALAAVPADWLAALDGEVMMAAHAALLPDDGGALDHEALSARWFDGNVLIGSAIAGGAAVALTDFRIHGDRFSRLLVIDRGMTPRLAGRMMQRLLEIDTYRLMALLALPVARDLTPKVAAAERELAEITNALVAVDPHEEPNLLDRLTRLEAEIESRAADSSYRFAAADAYNALVSRRIDELREDRIEGLQNFKEFMERRLAPAMNTCGAVAARLEALSRRIARATQLLSTRVDLTNEQQNRAVLESMNRRAKLQLRLQETVEGLSVAAVTYYIVGLVAYAFKGLKASGLKVDPDLAAGVSIPIVVVLVGLGVRQIRYLVTRAEARR